MTVGRGARVPRLFLLQTVNQTCPVSAASSTGRCNTIQCVDSTTLLQENYQFGCIRSKPSQGSVLDDLAVPSDFSLVFNAMWVRA